MVEINLGWLRQILLLLGDLSDNEFSTSPRGLAPHRVGSHLRHVLEFYECFLGGLRFGQIDYDSRQRDETLENSRYAAAAKICSIMERLGTVSTCRVDATIQVRVENADADVYLRSTIGRELQALSSHTIHHFALIAVTLRAHGYAVNPDFGMSPSTLRFLASKSGTQAAEAA
jgi:hypothetical protein